MAKCMFYVILRVAKLIKKLTYTISIYFYRNYALAYCRLRHVKLGGTQINFIGHTKLFISPSAKVEIGDKFICASGINNGIDNGIISKGVTIGEHSIVAAGSVVVKSIPANEIWRGNPAKFISKIECI